MESIKTNRRTNEILESAIYTALETYSNVHRGSGYNSVITTHLYEEARKIFLRYLGLNKRSHVLIICSPRRAALLSGQLKPGSFQQLSSNDFGLPLGVAVLAVRRWNLPKGKPLETGGGTARLMSREWEIWAKAPDRFEAGTPAIINTIAFAKALTLAGPSGSDIFQTHRADEPETEKILYSDELDQYFGVELMARLKETLIGRGLQVPTTQGLKPFVNLDNSASTRTFEPVWDVFRKVLFLSGDGQVRLKNESRKICAGFLGTPLADYDLIFTSNTTEAINIAAENLCHESIDGDEPVVLSSLLEHSSNDLPWRVRFPSSVLRLSIDKEGFIDLNELETLLDQYNQKAIHGNKRIRIVALSGASNVLGVCNNLQKIGEIVHRYGARFLVDAAQLAAHRKINMAGDGIDYLAFSGHKVYAPFGVGILAAKKGLLNFGSDELEQIKASGEQNAAGTAALAKSLLLLQRIGMDVVEKEEQVLTGKLLVGLAKINWLHVHGIKNQESPVFDRKTGVVVFDGGNTMSNVIARKLALNAGIGIRYGCHCAHVLVKHILGVGPKLERFQRRLVSLFPAINLPGVARMSLGIENTENDINILLDELGKISTKVGSKETSKVKKQINENKKAIVLKVFGRM